MAILISDKANFKTECILRDKEGHFVMIKEKIYVEDINNCKGCIESHNFKTHQVETNTIEGRKRQSHNNGQIFQHSALSYWQNNLGENICNAHVW